MSTVKLPDGREVDSASEEWRAFCEAQYVLQKAHVSARREFLAMVEKQRGKPAADKLRADILALWQQNQSR